MIKCWHILHTSERAWKAIGDRLQAPSFLSRVDHYWKTRVRKQRTDIGKYFFVNRSITDWNQSLRKRYGLPMVKCIFSKRRLGKCKPVTRREGNKKRRAVK